MYVKSSSHNCTQHFRQKKLQDFATSVGNLFTPETFISPLFLKCKHEKCHAIILKARKLNANYKKSVKQIGSKVYKICGIIRDREEFSLNEDLQNTQNWPEKLEKFNSEFNFSEMLTKLGLEASRRITKRTNSNPNCKNNDKNCPVLKHKKKLLKMHVFSILHLRFCIMLPFQMNFECFVGPSYSPFDLKSK